MTDAQELELARLFILGQQGDREAYERCLVGLSVELRGYVRARAGHVPWVDDVVQDTLLSVHNARHTFDAQRSFAAWFYAIARNRLIDEARRAKRHSGREIAIELLPEPAAVPSDESARGDLERALARLPIRQRQIITSMKLDGDSVRDVAARTGLSESAIKVAAHRGYRLLRRLLTARGPHD